MKSRPIRYSVTLYLVFWPAWFLICQNFIISNAANCEISNSSSGILVRAGDGKCQFSIVFPDSHNSGEIIKLQRSNWFSSDSSHVGEYMIQIYGIDLNGLRMPPVVYNDETHLLQNINDQTFRASMKSMDIPFVFHQPVSRIEVSIQSENQNGRLFLSFSEPVAIPTERSKLTPNIRKCPANLVMIGLDDSGSISPEDAGMMNEFVLRLMDSLLQHQIDTIQMVLFNSNYRVFTDAGISMDQRNLFWQERLENTDVIQGEIRPNSSYTNWEQLLDLGIEEEPDILIILSDGYPNWYENQRHSLDEYYLRILEKSKVIQSKGVQVLLGLLNTNWTDGHHLLHEMTFGEHWGANIEYQNSKIISVNSTENSEFKEWINHLSCPQNELDIQKLTIYPSPTNSVLVVTAKPFLPSGTLSIYSADGILMLKETIEQPIKSYHLPIDKQWHTGIYNIQLQTKSVQFIGSFSVIR